jgi:hypothetical protein
MTWRRVGERAMRGAGTHLITDTGATGLACTDGKTRADGEGRW